MAKKKKKSKRAASAKASVPQRGGTMPPIPRLAASGVVAALAFLLLVGTATDPMFQGGLLFRGVFAGVACGLLFGRDEWIAAGAAAFAGSLVSGVYLLFSAANQPIVVLLLAAVVIAGLLSAGVAWVVPRDPRWVRMLVVAAALTVCVTWSLGLAGGPLQPSYQAARARAAIVPQPEQYRFDAEIFIKTVDYMRTGLPYYAAFQRAWQEDARLSGPVPGAFNYREPLLFELWRFFPGSPGGVAILNSFILLAWSGVILTWLLARRFVADGVAMLAGLMMAPVYTVAAFATNTFSFAEIWAAVIVVGALCLLVRRRFLAAAIILTLAVAVRELAVIYIPAWIIAWWFAGERRKWAPGLAVAILGPVAALATHVALAPAGGASVGGTLGQYFHSTGIPRLLTAIKYGALYMLADWLVPLTAIASIAGAALTKEAWLRWTLLAVAIIPLLFLLVVSKTEFDYYWGYLVQPAMVALGALVFMPVLPSREVAEAR